MYTIPDLLVFFRRPLALEQLRSQMVAPLFPALLAVSIMEASSDRRPAIVCFACLFLPLPVAAPVRGEEVTSATATAVPERIV